MMSELARFVSRFAGAVVGIWFLASAAASFAFPQLEHVIREHSRSFFPADAASSQAAVQMGETFGDSDSNNLAYLVLENDHRLSPDDRKYYDRAVDALRADPTHVRSVLDLWSAPLSEDIAQSADHRVAYVMLQLTGDIGSSEATRSIDAVRAVVSQLPRPPGLHTFVTGPGPTIVDDFDGLDRQLLKITAVTVVVISLLLFLVYRSAFAVAIALITVGLSLAAARAMVAALGENGIVEVSVFSVSLMSAMVLGAGTDYAIFMLGRYHENRRDGVERGPALISAYRRVAPVIIASALTIAAALFCLTFSEVAFLRSAGIPCGIGILLAMAASLTLLPALIGLASRRGLIEPRPSAIARRWRRIGTAVVRWPTPLLIVGTTILVVCSLPLLGNRLSYDIPGSQPAATESNRGYATMNEHFPPDRLLPEIVLIKGDHDLRTSAGLIAIERVTRHVMAVRGVQSVQSASRPAGEPMAEASLTYQAGVIAEQLAEDTNSLAPQLDSIGSIQYTLTDLTGAIDQLDRGLGGATTSLDQIGIGAGDVRTGVQRLQGTVATVSGYVDPLRAFASTTPDCPNNPICATVLKVVDPVDSAVRSVAELSSGADKFADGAGGTAAAISGAEQAAAQMRGAIAQLRELVANLSEVTNSIVPQLREITHYLSELSNSFRGSVDGGFYLPQQIFEDPRYQEISRLMFSADGHATRLLVYGDGNAWSTHGAQRADEVELAVQDAIKEGTLSGSSVYLSGVSSATEDLRIFVDKDFVFLATLALALIFFIVTVMLRSPVAAVVVVATVIASYASALGLSAFLWRHIAGEELHVAVPTLAFIALVAVGADYNLLLAARIREESPARMNTAIIRAFAGTGGVVTTAGIVFGLTMFAMLTGNVLSIAQVGSTIGIGLMIDTLLVRTIIVPSIAAISGHWFWWPVLPWPRARERRG